MKLSFLTHPTVVAWSWLITWAATTDSYHATSLYDETWASSTSPIYSSPAYSTPPCPSSASNRPPQSHSQQALLSLSTARTVRRTLWFLPVSWLSVWINSAVSASVWLSLASLKTVWRLKGTWASVRYAWHQTVQGGASCHWKSWFQYCSTNCLATLHEQRVPILPSPSSNWILLLSEPFSFHNLSSSYIESVHHIRDQVRRNNRLV